MPNKKLHICIVTGQFPALTETFITNKVLELQKRGHKVSVVTNDHGGLKNETHLKVVKDAGIEILSFAEISSIRNAFKSLIKRPGTLVKSFSLNPGTFRKKYKTGLQLDLLTKYPFDIIHFEFSGLGIFYHDTIPVLKGKKVVSCRGTAEKVKIISEPGRSKKLENLFSAVDGIHCVSQDMAETVAPFVHNHSKIFVNRPSIDTEVFNRTKPYAENSRIQVLSIGRLTFQKGYLIGLLAVKELKQQGIDFRWTIVGDGPQKEELQYTIHTLGLSEEVQLVGKKSRDEIIKLYNNIDIFFLPSIYEGIANVCLEAMAMELPVISSDCSGMKEVIDHNYNGMLASNFDHSAMANHLIGLCNDYNKRIQLGKQARITIQEKFTLKRQIDVFEEQYQKLVGVKD